MPLAEVCQEVAAVLGSIELSSESAAPAKRIKRSFEAPPEKKVSLKSLTPCFILWADAAPERLRMGNLVEVNQTLQIDFYGEDIAEGVRFVREYFDATNRAISDQQRAGTRFNETVDYVSDLRTERPQEATMEWGGVGYPGFRAFLDLQWFEDVS